MGQLDDDDFVTDPGSTSDSQKHDIEVNAADLRRNAVDGRTPVETQDRTGDQSHATSSRTDSTSPLAPSGSQPRNIVRPSKSSSIHRDGLRIKHADAVSADAAGQPEESHPENGVAATTDDRSVMRDEDTDPLDSDSQLPTYVVGIGASAGGLQALEYLFDALAGDTGMAFIVIQHLSPDFDSMMDSLLARHTMMPVVKIEDALQLRRNHIYMLPPGKQAILANHRLLLTERSESSGLSFPIDEFFRSLAQNSREQAIGVILSGTGSDGSRGIRDIHASGGQVFVQTPDSAAFDGMPRSAMDTGVVDFMLTPTEISRALARTAKDNGTQKGVAGMNSGMEPVDHLDPWTRRIFSLLHDRFGLDFSQYKSDMIARRIGRRLKLSGMDDVDRYVEMVRADREELNLLYHDMLIGVTDFFRDAKVFERLALDVIPKLVDSLHEDEELRCWVAGTATGEEAYSLAILLAEEFEKRDQPLRIRIFASDVHEQSLSIAGRGVYSEDQMSGITPERLHRYFIERQDGYHVAPELRKLVVFTPHNVIRDAPFTRLDLISCRNLLIYLTPQTQQRVLSLFHFGLKSGGALCLGNSESLGELRSEFQPFDENLRIFRKHREVAPISHATTLTRAAFGGASPTNLIRERTETRQLLKTYDLLLERFLFPAILVNSRREIMHVFGGGGRFLKFEDGRPRNDIMSVIHADLRAPLSLALIHLKRDQEPISVESVRCELEDESVAVTLTVEAFDVAEDETGSVLIRIEQSENGTGRSQIKPLSAEQIDTVEHLERELQFTQDNLQSTIEQLQSTNEELQNTNEQLTASNEELQSTNEELHSVNEELYTVNAEHQRKIDELTELNDDIDNLLTTTNVHTLFLDSRLRLRRFTPRIAELFHLIPQDIGRPIESFTHKLEEQNLTESIREVIRTERPFQREVKDSNGQWYLLRIFPYLSRGTVEGAVVTLVDVTTLQAATEALQKSEERFDLAVRGSNAGIWDWKDVNQEPIWCSNRMYALLGRSPDEELTISFWRELIHPDDEDRALQALEEHLAHDTPFDIEYRMEYGNSGDYRWFHMRGAAERKGRRAIRMAGSFEDVTQRRKAEEEVQRGVARRDQFLAMLSHELRNPLGAITNATAVMSASREPQTADRAIGVVQRQLAQMARLLDDLLDVSRITHGKIELRTRPVDLRQIADEAISVVRQSIDESGLNFSTEIAAQPLTVIGDPARLEQVTVNLLTNAIKYTKSGGDIRLSLHAEGNNAVIAVQDSGAGIPAEKLGEIFSLFYQSDETLDRSNGGMGVGLTLVDAVVQLHGGRVTAQSGGPGQGSCFTVRLPLSLNVAASRPSPEPVPPTEIRSVLLVEDIDDAREMLSALLKLRGLTVHEASNGRDGLQTLQRLKPDVAIIDIGLPEMDGHEVARRVREDGDCRETRLVALTGYGQDTDRAAVQASGFDLHLVKPLNPDKLDEILSQLAGDCSSGKLDPHAAQKL
jgi:two-component system CheB/CheR fusion protein